MYGVEEIESFGPAGDKATVAPDLDTVHDDAPIDPSGAGTDAIVVHNFTRLDGINALDVDTGEHGLFEFNREFQLRGLQDGK